VWGQTPPDKDAIVTDRPDITEDSTVLPKGSIQLENGVAWTSDHGARTLDLPQSLPRLVRGFGLTHATPGHFIAAGYSFRFDHVLFRKGAL
jgi:hypothetical protein